MNTSHFYPIGVPGQPWTQAEKEQWLKEQHRRRDYKDIVERIFALKNHFHIERYGALSFSPDHLRLYALKSRYWSSHKPTVFITGGVHGYESSGVYGALSFLEQHASAYSEEFNFLCVPCVSPWGFETYQRWNAQAIDPNRSFYPNTRCEESHALMHLLLRYKKRILAHIDLHETTDTDETEFRPAVHARDGRDFIPGEIPDGFYLVADKESPQYDFQEAILSEVRTVTHIAPPDSEGKIIGSKQVREGVILYATKALGLCSGMTDAPYTTTTEVYPDSEKVTEETCIDAQVAAIRGALKYLSNIQP